MENSIQTCWEWSRSWTDVNWGWLESSDEDIADFVEDLKSATSFEEFEAAWPEDEELRETLSESFGDTQITVRETNVDEVKTKLLELVCDPNRKMTPKDNVILRTKAFQILRALRGDEDGPYPEEWKEAWRYFKELLKE